MNAMMLRKLYFRACPRCHGDLFLEESEYTCLQCGGTLLIPTEDDAFIENLEIYEINRPERVDGQTRTLREEATIGN